MVEPFDPDNILDARIKVAKYIKNRQGQPFFRKQLLQAYDYRCAISGCEVQQILEAAHIISYKGMETNHIQNGILLRSDLHTLFDLRLLTIDEKTLNVLIHPSLGSSEYNVFQGKAILLPKKEQDRPSLAALALHQLL